MTPEQRLYGPDTRPMKQPTIDRFLARGVPPRALTEPDMVTPAVVYPHDENDDRFSFGDEVRDHTNGVSAFLIALRDETGDILDLAAWRPKGDWLATWLGVGWALGQHECPWPLCVLRDDGAVTVFASPMDWLAADRRGIVVIDWRRARRPLLDASGPYIADDLVHAQRLRKELTIATPRIFTPSIIERVAA